MASRSGVGIRPECASGRAPPKVGRRSDVALLLEERSSERFFGRLASPDEEIEGGQEAINRLGGPLDGLTGLARIERSGFGQQYRIAEDDSLILLLQIEMAEPQTLVDRGHEERRLNEPPLRNADVERRAHLERREFRPPGEPDTRVAPGAQHGDMQLHSRGGQRLRQLYEGGATQNAQSLKASYNQTDSG